MQLEIDINYSHMVRLLDRLRGAGVVTAEETAQIKCRLVEICQPDPEYIR